MLKRNYPSNTKKRGKPLPEMPTPWDKVVVRRKKLSGGILTDELLYSIAPVGHLKENKNGLIPIALRDIGRVPGRSHQS